MSNKCQCCKKRKQTRTLFKNGKPLKLCDFCDTQKPPAKAKPKPPQEKVVKRIKRTPRA